MIKVEVLEDFNLKAFNELKNIVRKTTNNEKNKLYQGDIFECDKEMADYLLGNNVLKRAVVKVIEVEPIKEKEPVEDVTIVCMEEKVKTTKKKKSSKK